ncbi:ubiquitin carboxyl-terminal hydrolase [Colletotrichum karsti]|uniref:Ubiquitin carboxyl-terminal hydrolase n=1 Tax=Colletotrichum karsti TaxID=1095194 RepID=A0A9P6I052_9PEZI|nr:ubiquitin carboxyl-terminal hydrolase [Colletotrichum karsti]KAF9874053.1 ubiquitin carboxyl-terminal hydrolase [Colletotrichum karsti]
MDQPTASSEAPERAVSSEPSSTRPNPFTEGDDASRKRRRTSLSGGSRSRSVESTRSGLANSSSPAADILADDLNPQDSAMKIDTGPSTPQTPDLQSTAREPPTEPPSSRVTINLRNAAQPDSSSSPVSPTPQSLPNRPIDPLDGVRNSVENLDEVDMVPATIEITDTPPSSSSSMQSPEVEIVAIPDDDQDAPYDDDDISIVRAPSSLDPAIDPTTDFPFNEPGETLLDTVSKVMNFLPSNQAEESAVEPLRGWMMSYINYVQNVGPKAAYQSHVAYRNFWHLFPETAWVLANKKPPTSRDSQLIMSDFFSAYSRLASLFVEFDYLTAQAYQVSPDAESRQPEFLLGRYIQPVTYYARREESRAYNGQLTDDDVQWPARTREVSDMVDQFQSTSGSLRALNKLTRLHLSNASRYQHLMDVLMPIGNIAALILNKAVTRARQIPEKIEIAKAKLADGHILYNLLSEAFSTAVEKNVTQLSVETARDLIFALTELLKTSLLGDHPLAMERIKAHRQMFPELPSKFTADAISMEWRLGMFAKLITSSQMQLRVMSASVMCSDLISFYKRFSDNEDDKVECAKFLSHIAEFLLRTRLVDYILGPSCHPEITNESGNIVGFLVVTHFYRNEHTDLLWQTISTTQDPRIAEALLRMTGSITNLFSKEELLYLCQKMHGLPLESFTVAVRNLCTSTLNSLATKIQLSGESPSLLPLSLCIRLLRESSVYNSDTHIAYPEVHQFAINRFRELAREGLDPEIRRELYADCIRDISAKTPTTLGTLWCLLMASQPAVVNEVRVLATEHNLTSLLIDEFEHAIQQARRAGVPMVLCEQVNRPRRDLISVILMHEPTTVTSELGPRLWDMLVAHGAACQEDRSAGWYIVNNISNNPHPLSNPLGNPFFSVCFTEYLPTVPRDCFCDGTLQFVKKAVLPRVNDINDIILDDDESLSRSGVQQLWRMILDADNLALVEAAIQTLVSDIYIDSKSILAYPHHRACQVHLGLVNRCLKQMEDAAKHLESTNDGGHVENGEQMAVVETEEQTREQERIFTRSLAVLRHFLKAHQAKAHFSAPDLRALTPGSPGVAEGEPAGLKYQSFDGDRQTDIMPLEVGRQNTAASLLASIRQATGFDNYRIYYRGHPFAPKESEVCRSLEDLEIHDGLILVKREDNGTAAATRIKPGASLLEIEILGHFEQLWNYLSLQEGLAREIHAFLIKLPADAHMLAAFDSPDTSYRQIFPLGQPFKCLYALYAMREYMDSAGRRLKEASSTPATRDDAAVDAYLEALVRVRRLVVSAISDPELIESCASEMLKSRLTFSLMNAYTLTFREPVVLGSAVKPKTVVVAPADRLVDILKSAVTERRSDAFVSLVASTFTAILKSVAIDPTFWAAFQCLPGLEELLSILLLQETSDAIRANVAKLIEERIISPEEPTATTRLFCEFLWSVLNRLLPTAAELPKQCQQVFALSHLLLAELVRNNPAAVDVPELAQICGELLLEHESAEKLGQFGPEDVVAKGLTNLLYSCLRDEMGVNVRQELPDNFGRKLFWRHLFPAPRPQSTQSRSCILSTQTRSVLTEVIFGLVTRSPRELSVILGDLDSLVPHDEYDTDPYLYELQPQFDRMSAVRAPCGYSGLRNLSNTCYLNSLLTQLFMNTGFRQFMINATTDQLQSHNLVRETQKLFSFLQESTRKFIDPSLLVGCIKTYDDSPIDIHNQMDVDEFYNLLFDRWEGQLSTEEERQALRSFYGGQLVQQVASKECEHISERLEPFSAIQCDIKGKLTLQDSLQAYVDGEIMEGDNKYKCSSCDRHVDAVKRACLKDIPDNLIFHLKRFDFNLRTLMRSKINDYFSFPTKIDMRPYTIDHLGSPSESGEEDIFELVGVLVHAGTAESGHYYSYIRERPTSSSSEAWFEFNDDMVSPWNPADLEKSTFGGADGPFDNGITYDKTYSAYMLFYQRSSVLRAEQEKLQSLSLSTPLKVDVPYDIADHILGENTILLRRHCLYDPSHSKFILKLFQHTRMRNSGSCSPSHKLERRAMHMLLGHLDQVASRTKDLPYFELFRGHIERACLGCVDCSLSFFEYFQERPEAFRQLLQRNPDASVRFAIGCMFMTALRQLKNSNPKLWSLSQPDEAEEPIVVQVAQLFDTLWNNFHANIRSWPEVFQTILSFAKLGLLETSLLLSEDWFVRILRIIFADTNMDMAPHYVRMLSNVIRRANNTRATQYEMIIQLIDHFIGCLEDVLDANTIVDNPEMRLETYIEQHPQKLPWTSSEVNILVHEWQRGAGSTFIKKLTELNQDSLSTGSIIRRVMALNSDMEMKVFLAIRGMISGQIVGHPVAPYIAAAMLFSSQSRSKSHIEALFRHVADQCGTLQNAEGGAFLHFFKTAYQSLENGGGEDERDARISLYIEQAPIWAPGLLGYYEADVRRETQDFLLAWLSKYPPENHEDKFAMAVNRSARQLAVNCLWYLRDNFLQRRTQVVKQHTESLQNIILECEPYFQLDVEGDRNRVFTHLEFQELFQDIMEPLRRVAVEELEDDASGMSPGYFSDTETLDSEP